MSMRHDPSRCEECEYQYTCKRTPNQYGHCWFLESKKYKEEAEN
jgi:hypothetical protein